MERLTKYGNTSHENGVCCTHFNSKECHEVNGNCAYGCKWEEEAWSKLAHYEDLEEQGLLLQLQTEYVYCLVDVNTKWGGMVMAKSIKSLTIFEIEDIDKRNYYSTREKAEAALKEMEK